MLAKEIGSNKAVIQLMNQMLNGTVTFIIRGLGVLVMGGDSCLIGHELQSKQPILNRSFSHCTYV